MKKAAGPLIVAAAVPVAVAAAWQGDLQYAAGLGASLLIATILALQGKSGSAALTYSVGVMLSLYFLHPPTGPNPPVGNFFFEIFLLVPPYYGLLRLAETRE